MKVWLDDIRQAPEGWVHAYTVSQAMAFLQTGEVTELSLDHDLGENQATGYDLLNWIEEQVFHGLLQPPTMWIHSANPVGCQNMARAIESICRRKDIQ